MGQEKDRGPGPLKIQREAWQYLLSSIESESQNNLRVIPYVLPVFCLYEGVEVVICYTFSVAYGDRLKRGVDRRLSLLDRLRLILEHSHNAYTFRYRCKGLMIIIEKQSDKSIVAYYADDRDGSITIDTTQTPFDRIKFFYQQ